MNVTEINDSNIEEVIKSSNKVVIDCYADWCGPCKMLSPVVDEAASEVRNVKFCKINADNNAKTTEKYEIMSIPTILFFENGQLKDKTVGFKSKEEIIKHIGE